MTNDQMKEHPMLFQGRLVRAILSGEKKVTRRPVSAKHAAQEFHNLALDIGVHRALVDLRDGIRCPHGEPGDKLWVRETWAHVPVTAYRQSTGVWQLTDPTDADMAAVYRSGWALSRPGRWRPSLHMPRWACRILLPITSVRAERLQEVGECEARLEGSESLLNFKNSWDSIYLNKGAGWQHNPWVWRIEWKEIEVIK